MELTGEICDVSPVKQVTNTFRTRQFVLDISEEYNGQLYPAYAVMQAVNAVCDMLDEHAVGETLRFRKGDMVKVTFALKGSKGKNDDKYYNNLNAYNIVSAQQK